jgi:hypothetical protein
VPDAGGTRRRIVVLAVAVPFAAVGGQVPAGASSSTSSVTITMTGKSAKLSDTKHLRAGWITFRITSRTGENNLWFFTAHGAKTTTALRAAGAVQKPQAVPVAAPESAVATTEQADAAMARAAEASLLALGGADTSPSRPTTLVVQLPPGTVYVEDLANGAARVATLHVGAGPGKHHPHPDSYITADDANSIVAPATLPRTGTVKFGNIATGADSWHMLEIVRLTDPSTPKATVAQYFESEADDPISATDFVGSAPLSARHAQYVSYSLPAGTYAVVDYWVDRNTGHIHSADGSVAIVTLR